MRSRSAAGHPAERRRPGAEHEVGRTRFERPEDQPDLLDLRRDRRHVRGPRRPARPGARRRRRRRRSWPARRGSRARPASRMRSRHLQRRRSGRPRGSRSASVGMRMRTEVDQPLPKRRAAPYAHCAPPQARPADRIRTSAWRTALTIVAIPPEGRSVAPPVAAPVAAPVGSPLARYLAGVHERHRGLTRWSRGNVHPRTRPGGPGLVRDRGRDPGWTTPRGRRRGCPVQHAVDLEAADVRVDPRRPRRGRRSGHGSASSRPATRSIRSRSPRRPACP